MAVNSFSKKGVSMDFEKKRKEIFHQVAEKGCKDVDPETCLVLGSKLQGWE